MPIIEVDTLWAALSPNEQFHKVAAKVLRQVKKGSIKNTAIDAIALHELELTLKAGKIKVKNERATLEDLIEIFEDITSLLDVYGIDVLPFSCEAVIKAGKLRLQYAISFYDSHHAAAALLHDARILAFDTVYDQISELKRIDPRTMND
ncbi:MAG: PIN domain-containing protein [Candidatus Korarchaeota archaeon]|nr:PIN domain-containing protein [Candidatus Korarchaeota archaeon]